MAPRLVSAAEVASGGAHLVCHLLHLFSMLGAVLFCHVTFIIRIMLCISSIPVMLLFVPGLVCGSIRDSPTLVPVSAQAGVDAGRCCWHSMSESAVRPPCVDTRCHVLNACLVCYIYSGCVWHCIIQLNYQHQQQYQCRRVSISIAVLNAPPVLTALTTGPMHALQLQLATLVHGTSTFLCDDEEGGWLCTEERPALLLASIDSMLPQLRDARATAGGGCSNVTKGVEITAMRVLEMLKRTLLTRNPALKAGTQQALLQKQRLLLWLGCLEDLRGGQLAREVVSLLLVGIGGADGVVLECGDATQRAMQGGLDISSSMASEVRAVGMWWSGPIQSPRCCNLVIYSTCRSTPPKQEALGVVTHPCCIARLFCRRRWLVHNPLVDRLTDWSKQSICPVLGTASGQVDKHTQLMFQALCDAAHARGTVKAHVMREFAHPNVLA
jgi:hypothetical protein